MRRTMRLCPHLPALSEARKALRGLHAAQGECPDRRRGDWQCFALRAFVEQEGVSAIGAVGRVLKKLFMGETPKTTLFRKGLGVPKTTGINGLTVNARQDS